MAIFKLSDKLVFPSPELSEDNGLLAVGGDLSEKRLLLAYSKGIFPWFSAGQPILWWSPDPRLVLFPDELKVSRSLKQAMKKNVFKITTDTVFDSVIRQCAQVCRRDGGGTWITAEMIKAYMRLYHSGYAHSVESWFDGELVGGLYGVAIGKVFFGESMFAVKDNASKAAFVTLIRQLKRWCFKMIDCQVTTSHLKNFGAREISRKEFIVLLNGDSEEPLGPGPWKTEWEYDETA